MVHYEDCIVFLLAKAYQRAHSAFKMKLAPFGITPVQHLILAVLGEEEFLSPAEISDRVAMDGATLSGVLDRMAEAGLIKKEGNPEDRRSIRVSLSLKAKRLEAFKEKFRRQCDVLVLDGVQFLSGKSKTQAELAHTAAEWFPGARLNLVDKVFRHAAPDRAAVVAGNESGTLQEMTWHELERQVGALAASLRALGVVPGDRLVAILPNIPQTIVAFLACASVGAVWSVCSPDMGPVAVLDRFRQIAPKVLIAADGYRYGGKDYDRSALLAEVRAALPSLQHTVLVPFPAGQHARVAEHAVNDHPVEIYFAQKQRNEDAGYDPYLID